MIDDKSHINDPYVRGEQPNAGFRGEQRLSAGNGPVAPTIAPVNQSGDIAGPPAYPIPGQPALFNGNGVIGLMPPRGYATQGTGGYTFYPMANPDGYIYYDRLIYRSDTTPYRDGPNFRTLPSSPTTPVDRYRFLDGRRGDVYG